MFEHKFESDTYCELFYCEAFRDRGNRTGIDSVLNLRFRQLQSYFRQCPVLQTKRSVSEEEFKHRLHFCYNFIDL